MNAVRKRRCYYIVLLVMVSGVALALVLVALRKNLHLYLTPTQVVQGEAPAQRVFRLGGLVEPGSVVWAQNGLDMVFALTDDDHRVLVTYQGVLPALFREGRGAIVLGKLAASHQVQASEVLAKHDENYRPPIHRDSLVKGIPLQKSRVAATRES